MKKFLSLAAVVALSSSSFAGESDDLAAMKAELQALKSQVAELKKNQEGANLSELAGQVRELKMRTGGDNLKWDADYRASYDIISTKSQLGVQQQNGILSNRLLLGVKAAPRKDLSFIGQLAYNKAFGDTANHSQGNVASGAGYSNFDWVANENLTDNTVKVKTAYMIYFGNAGDVSYTASVGRRSSINGTLANLRSDDTEGSPNGHMINVEFDGASFNFNLDKVTGVPGMAFKLCMGRGLTNAQPRFAQSATGLAVDYMNDKTKDTHIDMFGFIFTPYDNGQYRVTSQVFKAWNLIGFKGSDMYNYGTAYQTFMGSQTPNNYTALQMAKPSFTNVGDMYGYTVSAISTGIGSDLGDFFDNSTAFLSWSMNKTMPNTTGGGMLGSSDDKSGQSWYVGIQTPAVFTKEGKIGLEYNTGSKYWRSFTYGEDTMVGSKLAARGSAKEVYYIQPILGKTITAEARYTHIDYDYAGSQGFFGYEGTPTKITDLSAATGDGVKSASNLMFNVRYRY